MALKLAPDSVDTAAAPAESKNANPLLPITGGEPVPAGGVILALCARKSTPKESVLCRQTPAGTFKASGRTDDIARAFAVGLLTL